VKGQVGVGAAVVGAGTSLRPACRRGACGRRRRGGAASNAAMEARSGAKPAGFGSEMSRSNPNDTSPASYRPAFSPTRGSSEPARGLV